VSRPALVQTPSPIQWVPGVLSLGVKRGRDVTLVIHPHLVPRSRMTSSPAWRLHGSSGTFLLLLYKNQGLKCATHLRTLQHSLMAIQGRWHQITENFVPSSHSQIAPRAYSIRCKDSGRLLITLFIYFILWGLTASGNAISTLPHRHIRTTSTARIKIKANHLKFHKSKLSTSFIRDSKHKKHPNNGTILK
jgi:hypothetical protein